MNNTKIEWTDYTWNPVVGCKHGCSYCYAERMNKRFKWIPEWNKPQYFQDRLFNFKSPKKPSKIFVVSIGDLFGKWINGQFIQQVINIAGINPQHTFQFLTKNPIRYREFLFPENCWLGVSSDGSTVPNIPDCDNNIKFVSFEPLIYQPHTVVLESIKTFNWVIIGGLTGSGAKQPRLSWIREIVQIAGVDKDIPVFMKNNLQGMAPGDIMREYPV